MVVVLFHASSWMSKQKSNALPILSRFFFKFQNKIFETDKTVYS